MKNTELWDSVCRTDPSATKKFTKGGGFSGTAVKPFWLMRRATETFGPCGIGWGWEELENKVVSGVWCSKVRLWYSLDESDGEIEQWGQTVMEGTNKNGAFVDEEAPKKAVTDAVTKCLSYLGFAGDVHMGLFDDSKYVSETAAEFKKEETARQRNERWIFIRDALVNADSFLELQNVWTNHAKELNDFKKQDEEIFRQLEDVKETCKQDLMQKSGQTQGFNSVRN